MSVRVCGDGLWSSWGEPHFRRLRADEPGRAQAAPQVLRAPGRSHQRGVPASLLRSRLALTRLLLGPPPAAWPQAPASSLCGRQPGPAGLRAWGLGLCNWGGWGRGSVGEGASAGDGRGLWSSCWTPAWGCVPSCVAPEGRCGSPKASSSRAERGPGRGPQAAPASIGGGWALPSWWLSQEPPPAIHPWCVSGGPVSGAARSSRTPLMTSPTGSWERGRPWGAASGHGEGHRVAAGAAGPLGVSGVGALQGLGSGSRLLPWSPHPAASLTRAPSCLLGLPVVEACTYRVPLHLLLGTAPARPHGSASPARACV